MARRASARNLAMGEMMRRGMSMKEAAAAYKGGGHHGGERSNPGIESEIGRHKHLLLYGGGGLLLLGAFAPSIASQIPVVGPLAVQIAAPLAGIVQGLLPAAAPATPAAQQVAQPSSALNVTKRPMGV